MHTQMLHQIRYQDNVYILVQAEGATQKQLERFLSTAQKAFNRLVQSNSAASKLHAQAIKKTTDEAKAKAYWTKHALDIKPVAKFVEQFNLTGDKEKFLLTKIRDAVFGKATETVLKSLNAYLQAAYISQRREEARKPALEHGIPKEILEKFFPKSYVFDVAPDGRITREFEVYGNEKKTIEAKRKSMTTLLDKWNTLAARLNKDLQSEDPIVRLVALVTSIIVNTGIRPGEGGESKMKDDFGKIIRDDEGNQIRVQTVGATGIKPEHINFVRDDFAVIEFPGKAGTHNVAELTDPVLVRALRAQLDEVAKGVASDTDVVAFVTPDGQRVTPKRVNSYLRSILGEGVSASDFRKLKATQTFYLNLKHRKHELAAELKRLKGLAEEDMRSKVVSLIVDHLFEAAEAAQESISHTDLETTIEYYISPRVALDYLSSKGINKALNKVVGNGRELQVGFDPIDFFETVTGGSAAAKAASTQRVATTMFYFGDEFVDYNVDNVIEELEEDSTK